MKNKPTQSKDTIGKKRLKKTVKKPKTNHLENNVKKPVGRPRKEIITKDKLTGDINGKKMIQVNPKTVIFVNTNNKQKIKSLIKKIDKGREFRGFGIFNMWD